MDNIGDNNSEKQLDYLLNRNQVNILNEVALNADSIKYNNILLIKFDSWIDLVRLKEAIVTAVNNHPFINSRIYKNEDGHYCFKKINAENNFTTKDIEEINRENHDIDDLKSSLAKPFKILNERLFRVKIIHAKGQYVFVEMHQIISDEASLHIFLENVSQAYLGNEMNKECLNGYELAAKCECLYDSEKYNKSKNYFNKYFEGRVVDGEFIGDINKSNIENADSVELVSRRAIADMIKSFCRNNNLTLNGFFTAAFGFLLSEYNVGNNALFTAVQAGRSDSRLKNTVFMLAKLFPVICERESNDLHYKILDYIKTVDSQLSEAQSDTLYPLEEMSKELGIKSDVLFYYRGEDYNFYSFCGKIAKPIEINSSEIKFPIQFKVSIHGAEICFNADYNSNIYSREYIECLLDSYDVIISEFLQKVELSEIETTSYKTVKMLNSFKSGDNADCEVLNKKGKLIPLGAFGYLYKSGYLVEHASHPVIARWLSTGILATK